MSPPATPKPDLNLLIDGRIIDHMGLEMYQSPVAAIAEMISNSWDADSDWAHVTLPEDPRATGAEIVIEDNGSGMTYEQCQQFYLAVARNKRRNPADKTPKKNRPMLGRKGIGKFAGFGIANIIRVETISEDNGEHTVFEMDVDKIRLNQFSINPLQLDTPVKENPNAALKEKHGTKITLKALNLGQKIGTTPFCKSMSRRFTILNRSAGFEVSVNGELIPEDADLESAQFVFPRDYEEGEKPAGMTIDSESWGVETLTNGESIRWQYVFYEDTIDEDGLEGVAIFAHGKLVQSPFLFNLTKGLSGQHGKSYLAGRVAADYLDELPKDIIAPERQRINWNHEGSIPLLEWGQERSKQLLALWKKKRAETRLKELDDRMMPFNDRVEKYPKHEQKVVMKAIKSFASVETLKTDRLAEMVDATLTCWEEGRLRDLISDVANAGDMDETKLLELLMEANVLTALNTAEAVKTKLIAIGGLLERVQKQELENAVRDYIAKNPWLISPVWETFRIENSVQNVLKAAAAEVKLEGLEGFQGRIDLALSSGNQLLVVEFMRPGIKADADHLNRFMQYVYTLRKRLPGAGTQFDDIRGLLVADKLDRQGPGTAGMLEAIRKDNMEAKDWETLLKDACSQWKDFLLLLAARAPDDERLQNLAQFMEDGNSGLTEETSA